MKRPDQIGLLKRLLHYVDTGTTAMAPAPWRNEVAAYTDPARFAREQDALFRKYPLMMGFANDWAKPGDYKTDDLSGVPILIVRGRDGVLRAFLNVCRHRGAKVVDGCGSAKAFSCAYHAWSYDLAGKVTHIPDERSFPGVKAERPALTPLPLCEKHGLVWVIATPDGSASFDVDPWLGPALAEDLDSYGFATWHGYASRTVQEPMNWKLVLDTFLEGYHIGYLHQKTLTGILQGNTTDFLSYGDHHLLTFARSKLPRLKQQPESEWDLMWNTTLLYVLFPNTVLAVQGDHVELFRIFPAEGRVDRSSMETSIYIPKPAATDEERRHWDANLNLVLSVVLAEDFPAGRTIQAGFASGAQSHTIYGRNEPAMIHWHQAIRRKLDLPVEPVARAVAAE